MKINNQTQCTEVKNVKFHHRVKRFYYKNLFRKIYTVAIVGLIAANVFSLFQYQSFAQESEWNTATLVENSDGSHTITYDGMSYTVAGNPVFGKALKWGVMTEGGSYSSDNNAWGGAGDTASNGYSPTPDNYDTERRGPCPAGYHVPSRGEWAAVVTAWCHLSTNTCTGSNLQKDGNNNLTKVTTSGFSKKFQQDFNLASYGYWTSTPYGTYARFFKADDSKIDLTLYQEHNFSFAVLCFKNPGESIITFDANGGSIAFDSLVTDDQGHITLPTVTKITDSNGERILEGWFASTGDSERLGRAGETITLTADTTLYAHWAQTISIEDPANPLSGFTIMDRNLGAITNEISSTDSYGFHYQWGNNYGFPYSSTPTVTTTGLTWDSSYDNHGYYNTEWIDGTSHDNDVWNNNSHHDGVWGGTDDYTGNSRGLDTISSTATNRQGPCPEGWHVPSAGEWSNLLEYWADNYTGSVSLQTIISTNLKYFSGNSTAREAFQTYFQLPSAGYRNYGDASLGGQGVDGYYWSSSPSKSYLNSARRLTLDSSDVRTSHNDIRIIGYSVRCFKDEYVPYLSVSFDTRGGTSKESIKLKKGMKMRESDIVTISELTPICGHYQLFRDVLVITGADAIDLSININSSYAGFAVWEGNHPDYRIPYHYSAESDVDKSISGIISAGTHEYHMLGDTATIGYVVNDDGHMVCYGSYSATMTGIFISSEWIGTNPTKTGFVFKGWYTDEELTQPFSFYTPITENITLYAQYECNPGYIDDGSGVCVKAATITFNPNGGATATGTITVISGSIVKLSDYTATKADYEFIGWNNSPTSEVALADDYLADKNITLYAIYRKAPSSRTTENGDFQILNITSTGRILFTILDRNLGAANTGAGSSANLTSYGSYYQWGNNYGFANSGAIITDSAQVDASSYGPSNLYNGFIFITRTSSPYGWDTTHNYNLWGGQGDTVNTRGAGTDRDRRGPCPAGYHVPSTLEWNQARDIRCQAKMGNEGCTSEAFAQDLLLPYAGHRNSGTGEINSQGGGGYYWSSSRLSDDNAYDLNISSSNLNPQQDDRTPAGYSVRCFMNTTSKNIIYNTNGGDSLSTGTAISRWKTGNILPTPIHSDLNQEFMGWYVSSGFEAGTQVTTTALSTDANGGSITLYAKWHDSRCEEGRKYDEELGICYEEGIQYLVIFEDYDGVVLQSGYVNYRDIPEFTGILHDRANYDFVGWLPTIHSATGDATYIAEYKCSPGCGLNNSGVCITPGEMVEGEDFFTITAFDPTNPRSGLTIMDRNLGSFSGSSSSRFYYQWGNNFGFVYPGSLNLSGTQVDASDFGPGNYYNSSIYINNSAGWDSSNNNNLWGGSGDNASNNRGANQTNPTDRRGPCPEGYHIPSEGEWGLLIKYWGDTTHREYISRGDGLYYVDGGSAGFMNFYQLKSHGFLYPNGNVESAGGGYGYYWSSSPQRILYRDPRTLEQGGNSSSFGFSVRCFSDTYEAPYIYDMISGYDCADGYAQKGSQCVQLVKITYHPNGGAFSGKEIDETITVKYDVDYVPDTNIQFPNKASDNLSIQSGWMFAGWYTDTGYSNEWIGLVGSGTRSQTVYARWLPFNDMILTMSGVTFTIMDRNLGATEIYNQNFSAPNAGSMGSYYQWGNNYGFPNTGWNYVIDGPIDIDTNEFGPGNYYYSSTFVQGTGNRSITDNRNLWGGAFPLESDSYRQGPCPKGYHVPLSVEWNEMFELWCGEDSYCWGYMNPKRLARVFYLPFAGSYGYPFDSDYKVGGYRASDTSLSMSAKGYYIDHIDRGPSEHYRTSGSSVRCFKDSIPIKITYDIKGGDTTFSNPGYITRWWESPTNLSTNENTNRPNSIFGGWYTTPGFEEGTQVLNNEISTDRDITLYAKWTCENHYHINGNACEKDVFQITWKDGNGNTLKTEMIEYGETPGYSGTTPSKARTPQYTYTFNNTWSPEIQSVTDNATYTAQFDSMVNKYNITFVDEDGETVLKATREYDYGTPAADIEKPADPEKAEDRHYIYTFAGWTPAISEVTEHRTYRATYSSIAKEYEITWKDGNGDILKTEWIEYGETPSYSGITPTKSRTPQYTYTFNNTWSPEIQSVTDDATYTAQFDSTVNQYQIRFVNTDGTQLQAGMVAYGDTPTFTNALPNNPYHVFMGWNPNIVVVTTGATYTTKWGEDINENGIYDALENRYRVVVHYIYSRGGAVTGDRVVNDLLSGLSYNVVSPVISHYSLDKESVSGIITGHNIEATVIYRPNTDINNNGIADEEENLTSVIRKSSEKPVRRKTKNSLPDETEVQETHGSATQQPEKEVQNNKKGKFEGINIEKYSADYSREMNEAYQFSYVNKITNQRTIQEAGIFEDITRIQMAKMLSNYAINVLGQKPDISKGEMKFDDVPDRLNYQYDKGVTTAYQLGIMGINMENNMFRPNDNVTRAEFATALSRMLYDTADGKGKTKYYEPHISKLFKEGIISDTNPDQLEKRGYVMTMLLRGVK